MSIYSLFIESNYTTKTKQIRIKDRSLKTVIIKEEKRKNKNDPLSENGIKLSFFDKDTSKIGEASISGLGTDMPFLYDFEIKESLRGHGYGSTLLDYMIKEYKVNDLSVSPSNKNAIRLYKKHGFKERFKYKDGNETLQYMQINKRGYENKK